MEDRYLDIEQCINRLVCDYQKNNILYIAYDFDNTVFDYHNIGDNYPKVEKLLKFLKEKSFKLILFTANDGEDLEDIVKYCKFSGYEPDYINESPVQNTKKPYYHILLDDRAGLCSAYKVVLKVLNRLGFDYKE
jgi:phosphoglycolate phosphatase-like HAD superfamily hydrolase